MDYNFNCEVAKIYGVEEAVFLHNLYWWITKNEANGRHYYEGKNWTYNTLEAFTKLFPFWSRRQIQRIVANLKNKEAIYIGNFNQRGFDRTQWYALDESVYIIYQTNTSSVKKPTSKVESQHLQVCSSTRPSVQTNTTIPDSKPDISTDSKPDRERRTAPPTPKMASPKCSYGENGWVRLSDGEHQNLLKDMGPVELERCITYLDESAQITSNKNQWKDWNLVLRKCSREGWGKSKETGQAKPPSNQNPASYDLGELESRLLQNFIAESGE